MHDEVGYARHRIVPSEIFEIQEIQFAIRPSQGVVRAEIGGDQGAAFRGDLRREIKSQPPIGVARLGLEAMQRRDKHIVEKRRELGDVMLDCLELGVTALDMGHDAQAGETGFGGLADLRPGPGVDRGVEGDLEGRELGDVGIGNGVYRIAVDPAEQGITKLGRYRDDPRRAADAAAFEETQGADFGLESISIVGCRVFLQRVATCPRIDLKNAAVVALAELGNRRHRLGAERTGDLVDIVRRMERAHHKLRATRRTVQIRFAGRCRKESCGRSPAFRRAPALRQDRRRRRRSQVPVSASLCHPACPRSKHCSARGRGPTHRRTACFPSTAVRPRAGPSAGHNARVPSCGSRWRPCRRRFRHLSRNSVTPSKSVAASIRRP